MVILIVCKSVGSWLRVLGIWISLVKNSGSFKPCFSSKCGVLTSKTSHREFNVCTHTRKRGGGRKESRSLMSLQQLYLLLILDRILIFPGKPVLC